jgi:hypothetical protein
MKRNKVLALAGLCLGLDVVAFITLALLICAASNMWCVIFLGILLYAVAWDAFHASVYLMNHFKN